MLFVPFGEFNEERIQAIRDDVQIILGGWSYRLNTPQGPGFTVPPNFTQLGHSIVYALEGLGLPKVKVSIVTERTYVRQSVRTYSFRVTVSWKTSPFKRHTERFSHLACQVNCDYLLTLTPGLLGLEIQQIAANVTESYDELLTILFPDCTFDWEGGEDGGAGICLITSSTGETRSLPL
ncbi:MAG TPA: hypothetical protein VLA04_00835 [Verrucomicrobiae bacterium]|nr:hypothetical protein [Verrucomicrobiae bacterium]